MYPPDKTKMGQPKPAQAAATQTLGVKTPDKTLLADGPLKQSGNLTPDALRGYTNTPPKPPGNPCGARPCSPVKQGLGNPCGARPCSPVKQGLKKATPPRCGVPGTKGCPMEKNSLPPNEKLGRFVDPTNPTGSVTSPYDAQEGDYGYAPECGSARRDQNNTDDPAGVQQHACCANSITLREGCCGQQCTVWSQKAKLDGTGNVELRDGAGRVCTNKETSLEQNICGGAGRTRENTIPKDLEGTNGSNPPEGFIKPANPPAGQSQQQQQPPAQPVSPGCNVDCKPGQIGCTETDSACSERQYRRNSLGTKVYCGRDSGGGEVKCATAGDVCINSNCAAPVTNQGSAPGSSVDECDTPEAKVEGYLSDKCYAKQSGFKASYPDCVASARSQNTTCRNNCNSDAKPGTCAHSCDEVFQQQAANCR
jgi:hypothetical protein